VPIAWCISVDSLAACMANLIFARHRHDVLQLKELGNQIGQPISH